MANLQVRDINDQLYEALKRRAELEHRSVSQEVVRLIENYLSHDRKETEQRTFRFLELANSWSDKRTASEIVKEIKSARTKNNRGQKIHELFD